MAFFEKTKIADTDGDIIQPAREDGILLKIFNLLSAPLGFDKSLSRQRVTAVIDTALPAGSNAVGTVAINAAIPTGTNSIGDIRTLTNIGGTGTADFRPAQMLINQTNYSAWYHCVRTCIT